VPAHGHSAFDRRFEDARQYSLMVSRHLPWSTHIDGENSHTRYLFTQGWDRRPSTSRPPSVRRSKPQAFRAASNRPSTAFGGGPNEVHAARKSRYAAAPHRRMDAIPSTTHRSGARDRPAWGVPVPPTVPRMPRAFLQLGTIAQDQARECRETLRKTAAPTIADAGIFRASCSNADAAERENLPPQIGQTPMPSCWSRSRTYRAHAAAADSTTAESRLRQSQIHYGNLQLRETMAGARFKQHVKWSNLEAEQAGGLTNP
jgi:hypothetical protein